MRLDFARRKQELRTRLKSEFGISPPADEGDNKDGIPQEFRGNDLNAGESFLSVRAGKHE